MWRRTAPRNEVIGEKVMKTKSGVNSGATRKGARPWVLFFLGAVLSVGLASFGTPAEAKDLPAPMVPFQPGECAQFCFEGYVMNIARCKLLNCSGLLFFTWCDSPALAQCMGNAQTVFELCLADC